MTCASCSIIIGRPFENERAEGVDFGDFEDLTYTDRSGSETQIFTALYQGDAFFGLNLAGVWGQGSGPIPFNPEKFTISDKDYEKAREICELIPEEIKNHPELLPFGAYIVGDDG